MACKVSAKKSADNLMAFLLYVISCCFSLASLKIFPINFCHFNYNMCLGVNLFEFTFFVTVLPVPVSFPRLGKFSAIISSNSSPPPFLSSPSRTPGRGVCSGHSAISLPTLAHPEGGVRSSWIPYLCLSYSFLCGPSM